MESREKSYDIVIIGGGLVGGTLAQALSCHGLNVVVIDENDPQTLLKNHVDGRSYAISLGSKRILDELGLWQPLNHPIDRIKIGSDVEDIPLTYHYSDIADEPLGFLVEATKIRRTILEKCLDNKAISWISKTTVDNFSCTPENVHLKTNNGETLRSRLLLACDGAFSKTRETMNIPTTQWNYDQLALVFNVNHAEPHNNTAFEIFTSEGPFAMLPYPKNCSGCVWSLKKDRAEDFLQLSEKEQNETLNGRFNVLLGALSLTTPVRSFSLKVNQPHTYIGTRFALVGDAAHLIHPVAGQGLNLGFRDVKVLTNELAKAKNLGLDIGSSSILKAYQRRRRYDNLSLLGITDFSARALTTRQPLFRWACSKGFSVMDKAPSLKKYMMRHAMGLVD